MYIKGNNNYFSTLILGICNTHPPVQIWTFHSQFEVPIQLRHYFFVVKETKIQEMVLARHGALSKK
jgi:hypothetical protein